VATPVATTPKLASRMPTGDGERVLEARGRDGHGCVREGEDRHDREGDPGVQAILQTVER
jgi:hypothetical protein